MMKMKSMFSLKRLGMTMSALLTMCVGASLASCDREKPNCKPDPERKGVEVLVDAYNIRTGVTTRLVSGDAGYNFTDMAGNGTVRMQGGGFKPTIGKDNNIDVFPTFFGDQNVVFKGWSWRYSDDPEGTHRNGFSSIQSDFVITPMVQPDAGLQKMVSDKFTCQYRPGSDHNQVYVKVNYDLFSPALELPELPPLEPIYEYVCGYCGRFLDYGSCNCEETRNYGDNIVSQEFPNPAIDEYETKYVQVYKKNPTIHNYQKGIEFWKKAPSWIPGA